MKSKIHAEILLIFGVLISLGLVDQIRSDDLRSLGSAIIVTLFLGASAINGRLP